MTEFLLDTEVASRLLRADRFAVTHLRRSGATALSISSVTMAELVYGARLNEAHPSLMVAVRAFLARIEVHSWDAEAAEAHARIRLLAKRGGRSAGVLDVMIAAHALARGATLVSRDATIKNLAIEGLIVVRW